MGRQFNHIVTQETRDKISRTKKAQGLKGEKAHNFGKPLSLGAKAKLSAIRLGRLAPPCDLEAKNRKIAEGMQLAWRNPEIRKRMVKALKESHTNSFALKGTKHSPELCEINRQAHLKLWQDSEFRAKMIHAWLNIRSPNKMELQLLGILDKHFPCEWQYVGDGKLIIAGLCPDFVNVNGKKQIIEFFGRWWHSPEQHKYKERYGEEYRTRAFAGFGYKTLIIWSDELKNEAALVGKLKQFSRT